MIIYSLPVGRTNGSAASLSLLPGYLPGPIDKYIYKQRFRRLKREQTPQTGDRTQIRLTALSEMDHLGKRLCGDDRKFSLFVETS